MLPALLTAKNFHQGLCSCARSETPCWPPHETSQAGTCTQREQREEWKVAHVWRWTTKTKDFCPSVSSWQFDCIQIMCSLRAHWGRQLFALTSDVPWANTAFQRGSLLMWLKEATGASASLFCKHCHNIHCLLLLLLLLDFNQLLHQYPPVCSACTLRRKQRLYYFHMLLPFHAWAD